MTPQFIRGLVSPSGNLRATFYVMTQVVIEALSN